MAIKDVPIPDIGDFDSVEVVEVLVKAGDTIAAEDSLISLESDKATMEIPSPFAGVVKEVKVSIGDKVAAGAIILSMDITDGAPEQIAPAPESPVAQNEPVEGKAEAEAETETEEAVQTSADVIETEAPQSATPEKKPSAPPAPGLDSAELTELGVGKPHASPSVRLFARELGVDLKKLRGSGPKGRILKEDIQQFVKAAMQQGDKPSGGGFNFPELPVVDFSKFGEIERLPLTRIQKLSGAYLHRNWVSIPHVTQFDEADITELEKFRKSQLDELSGEKVKLTLLAFIIKACAVSLKDFPRLNSSLEIGGEQLILKKYFNIGVATDTDEGLVVPVVRDVDKKGLLDIAREVSELAAKAKGKRLIPKDIQGATFSVSSLGGLGGTGFTPIINAPEVAVLGVSRAAWKPVYRDGEFVPRLILPLSLSYDHRVVDGAEAVRFTSALCADLSDVRRILL